MVEIGAIVEIAEQAGQAILKVYERDFSVQQKADDSPLTEADMAAHHSILAALQKLTPDIPVLSEESAAIPYAQRRAWSRYWLIDPLDGTKEFIRRNGEFTVNIAFIENGCPILGVVHVPVTGESYLGKVGVGAWKRQKNGNQVPIKANLTCQTPIRIVGSRSHAGESLQAMLQRLGEHRLISMGSSLKLCLVAEGQADLYPRLGPTSEWDTAAAQAVVEAAGGQVANLELQPLRYNQKDSLLNPHFLVFADTSVEWSDFL
jgi:3'(2'), 5'-bisphosphate nucleotidase